MTNTFAYTDHEKFDSSFADEAFYDHYTETVAINLTNGDSLTYKMPVDVWREFAQADSQGRFFQRNVRGVCEYLDTKYDFFVADRSAEGVSAGADEDYSSKFKYSVTTYFDNHEQAYLLFSYAEAMGSQTTMTAFTDDSDD